VTFNEQPDTDAAVSAPENTLAGANDAERDLNNRGQKWAEWAEWKE
jgi:hypothetical protein